MIYDCFVLNEKAHAVYYHGSQAALSNIIVQTSATASGKSTVNVVNPNTAPTGYSWYYVTASTVAGLVAVVYGTAITTSDWTALSTNPLQITPSSGDKYVRVVLVKTADSKPVAFGDAVLNIG